MSCVYRIAALHFDDEEDFCGLVSAGAREDWWQGRTMHSAEIASARFIIDWFSELLGFKIKQKDGSGDGWRIAIALKCSSGVSGSGQR